jgi:hypothetical protein
MAKKGGNPQNFQGKNFKTNPERINKKGAPHKLPHLEKLLANVLGEEKDGKTAAEAILMALRGKATRGDVRAAEVLLDRAFGKVKQDIGITGAVKFKVNVSK